ncbi:hypothetical protein [Salipiger bermudensis]|uniref:hypothetical protein n=1 Tax=Salipiger bermudensis TaxID=344736 RepID=UPI001CD326FA|nr:hypothetical protein [Salipiger bermudensis]MCA0961144.1 hypothetical protein [Salipiger bermudensis]
MDLTKLDLRAAVSEGAEFELKHPGTGEGIGVFPTVLGYDSEEVETAERDLRRRASRAKDREAAVAILERLPLVRAQTALTGLRGGSGETSTVEKLSALMAKPGFIWIIEQIEAFAGDRASFFSSAEDS